jgi:hypothetical protein
MLKVTIHFGVHNHHVVNGKNEELIEEIRRLIVEKVDAKISSISLNVNETLANYLFDDSSNGIVELLKGEQLEHI